MDVIGRFLEECCVIGPEERVDAPLLTAAYQRWCRQTGEFPHNARVVAELLSSRGLSNARGSHGVRRWSGVRLNDRLQGELGISRGIVSQIMELNDG